MLSTEDSISDVASSESTELCDALSIAGRRARSIATASSTGSPKGTIGRSAVATS
jgi:hypothetical protein